jgi:pimeloyl-ACP methyl ester carboxylesterase
MPFADINGHSLHYTDIAPLGSSEAAHTIIFVHGLGSTQNYYFPIFPYLTSFRCILFDNYGAGRSKYDGKETSIPLIGKDVLGLLDHLKVQKAIVVGYSMGGMVPTFLASTSPDRVVAGVCIGPVHPSEAVANVFKQRVPTVRKGELEPKTPHPRLMSFIARES